MSSCSRPPPSKQKSNEKRKNASKAADVLIQSVCNGNHRSLQLVLEHGTGDIPSMERLDGVCFSIYRHILTLWPFQKSHITMMNEMNNVLVTHSLTHYSFISDTTTQAIFPRY